MVTHLEEEGGGMADQAHAGARLRALMDEAQAARACLVLPGVFDGLSARLAAAAGAPGLYMTGFGVAGSLLGKPDIGLVTGEEMAGRVRALVPAAAPVPLLADGDDGHGGTANVERLVQAYEAAGAGGIQLEDQAFPKRCGHMQGKRVVERAEATAKIRAAAAARSAREFLIVARTDARATHDLDEALARGEAFLSAGADVLFIEAPQSAEELERIARHFQGAHLLANLVEDGATPMLSPQDLGAMGYCLALRPIAALLAAAETLRSVYGALANGAHLPEGTPRLSFSDYNEAMGLGEISKRATAYVESTEDKAKG